MLNDSVLPRYIGKDIRPSKFWLDIDYPAGPPREYEWTGLVTNISDN
jgi:hypothetical protein